MIVKLQALIRDLPLPKAELNTRNSTKRPPLCGRLVEFLVFNSINLKKSDPPDAENHVVYHASTITLSQVFKNIKP